MLTKYCIVIKFGISDAGNTHFDTIATASQYILLAEACYRPQNGFIYKTQPEIGNVAKFLVNKRGELRDAM